MICMLCDMNIQDALHLGNFVEKNGVAAHASCLLYSPVLIQKYDVDRELLGFAARDVRQEAKRAKKIVN